MYEVWDKNDGMICKDKIIGSAEGTLKCKALRVGGTEAEEYIVVEGDIAASDKKDAGFVSIVLRVRATPVAAATQKVPLNIASLVDTHTRALTCDLVFRCHFLCLPCASSLARSPAPSLSVQADKSKVFDSVDAAVRAEPVALSILKIEAVDLPDVEAGFMGVKVGGCFVV